MFKKIKVMTLVTRFKNEDNLKITKLVNTWKKPGSEVTTKIIDEETVWITMEFDMSCYKAFRKDLSLLTFVGIYVHELQKV